MTIHTIFTFQYNEIIGILLHHFYAPSKNLGHRDQSNQQLVATEHD